MQVSHPLSFYEDKNHVCLILQVGHPRYLTVSGYKQSTVEFMTLNLFSARVEFGIWLKHHRKIWNLTRRSQVRFQISLWCLKAKFKIPLSAEACLQLTPRHVFINPLCSVNGIHRLSTYLTLTFYYFWDRSGQHQNVFETVCVFAYLRKKTSTCRLHKVRVRCCNQNHDIHLQSNFLKGAATLHISLRIE